MPSAGMGDQLDGTSCNATACDERFSEGGGGPDGIIPADDKEYVSTRLLDRDGGIGGGLGMGAQASLIEGAKANGLRARGRHPRLVIGDEW